MNMKRGILATALALAATMAFAQSRSLLNRNRPNANNNGAAATPAVQPTASAAAADGEEASASDLNFKEAPLDLVFTIYGKLVDRTVLKDPATPANATITLESRPGQKLTKEEQIEAIEVVCEMNGIHFENYGEKFVRALPRKEASKESVLLFMDPAAEGMKELPMGKVISVMISFKNISAQDEGQKALEGFKSASGLLQVFERTNSILVTDTRQNIERMAEIARAIDISTPVLENVYVRQIKNASATDIKTAIEQIVTESQKQLEKESAANKNGTNAARDSRPATTTGSSLLRRPGQNNNKEPATPANIESIVTSVSDADRGMIRGKVVIVPDERSNKLIFVTSKSNMDFFDKVIESLDVETTPDTQVKVYRLKYAEAEDVSDMINDLIGNSSLSSSSRGNQNQNARSGTSGNITRNTPGSGQGNRGGNNNQAATRSSNQKTGEPKAGELSKENTVVLADKRINGLVVMTQKELVPTIENIIESMDIRLSQVLIETVIIEVQLGDDLQTGIDWLQRGRTRTTGPLTDSYGRQMYHWYGTSTDGTSSRTVTSAFMPVLDGFTFNENDRVAATTTHLNRDGLYNNGSYMLGGGGGDAGAASILQSLVGAGTNVTSTLLGGLTSGGANYFLKSDKLNLAAVIQASKSDSRSKYLASPVIMTVDNKEATIEATQMRYLFKGYQYSGSTYSGSPVKDYEQKELGITVKVTPKINPNGTVMLTVEEEYSQEGAGQMVDGELQATTVTRKMSADVVLENNQSVVFGGLTQTITREEESGIPILKDIPWIGKWLFGSVSQSESRQELLVFMTPYVLDDAEAAQAEAFRRKKALSDTNPWTDHGWSASALADPVPKKEMMRRLKDEWKKQDEERKTRLAIEKAKMDRARALEKMDDEERKFWIETHREELEKEEQEKFDEFLKEQEDLKKLAEDIKAKRMVEAQAAIDEAAKLQLEENEHGRLERESSSTSPAEAPSPAPASEPAPAPASEPAPTPASEPAPAPASEPAPAPTPAPEPVENV